MPSTDDRIVAMQFDNKVFEEKVAATIKSLDQLKTSLDFKNSKQGFADLNAAARGFNLDGIASAVEGIGSKFSAMGVIAFTVLQNITTKAIDAGIQLAKSLSLDQIISGFQEYETNMNAIQTVLANTKADGTNLDDVNAALKQLNEYSDQTIYNFGEMARNIGTFTAAGVDLDTSVSAIKGIANLAAISGSNSQQASTAMYQLSQALASGSVKLMDWNSIVNAGMGGEVFQKSLFETGKALGTIKDTPIDMTFEEWTAAGNTFRGSLEDGWLTADVLTNTLQGFTGDLTDAQLLSLGYTQEQIAGIQEMGKTGKEAATKVKTLTQLISTVKESIGSGWSETFKILIGDFEEAKTLFTGVSNTIGAIVGASADARNGLLDAWKRMGGRDTLISGITTAFQSLGAILTQVKIAFQSVFPPMTAHELVNLTNRFKDFMESLSPSLPTLVKIRHIFTGIFSAFSIGIEIVKGIAGVFGDLFDHFKGEDGETGLLGFLTGVADKITALKKTLVDRGGIEDFFDGISEKLITFIDTFTFDKIIDKAIELFDKLKTVVSDFFTNIFSGDGVKTPGVVSDAVDNLKERFGLLEPVIQRIGDLWDWFKGKLDVIKGALEKVGGFIKDVFTGIPQKIADALANADYSTGLDILNTGLFAAFVLAIKKFLDGGIDIGGGIFASVKEALDGLTGTLEAMQTKLKAEALKNIAEALLILVASVVILSLIDSVALTKAMTAMAVGFGQLITAMGLLDKVTTTMGSAKMAVLATGLVALGGALLLMSVAVKIFSTMSWEELAKGLGSVAVLLGILAVAVKPLSKNSGGMITAGLGIIAIAIALNILALAAKSFAEMSWEEMAQGMVGIAASLGAIAAAMHLLPEKTKMISAGLGILAISVAMNIMALAVKSFAEMNLLDMAQGLIGVGGALLIVAYAMKKMPKDMILQGVALAAIGIGLVLIAKAMAIVGALSWGEIARGLVGLAAALLILGIAAWAMEEALPGAVAIGIMAVSLGFLADGLLKFSAISWGDLLHGLGALAATLGTLALAAYIIGPVAPALLAVAAALALMGLAFVLVGFGANLLATAFSIIATAGTQGVATLMSALDGLIERLPDLIGALADGFIELGKRVLKALPSMIADLSKVIAAILNLLIENIPKVITVIKTYIIEGLRAIREIIPELVATGLALLIGLLTGIKDNIYLITTTVVDIITGFLDALAEKVPEIIDSVYGLVVAILTGVYNKLKDVAKLLWPKGAELMEGLLGGVGEKAVDIFNWFKDLPGNILTWLGEVSNSLFDKGTDLIVGLLKGIVDKFVDVAKWYVHLPLDIIELIGNVLTTLAQKGKDLIQGLWDGGVETFGLMISWVTSIPSLVVSGIGVVITTLASKGRDLIQGLLNGAIEIFKNVITWLSERPAEIVKGLLNGAVDLLGVLLDHGKQLIQGFRDGAEEVWKTFLAWVKLIPDKIIGVGLNLGKTLWNVGWGLIEGLWKGASAIWDLFVKWVGKLNPLNWGGGNNPPATPLVPKTVEDGPLALGPPSSVALASVSSTVSRVVTAAADGASAALASSGALSPTITPVLDLTDVVASARTIPGIIDSGAARSGSSSYGLASTISLATTSYGDDSSVGISTTPTHVTFTQINQSPEALSTSDIYRNTNNQIALAKEELALV